MWRGAILSEKILIHGLTLLIWFELELLSFYYNKVPFFSVPT